MTDDKKRTPRSQKLPPATIDDVLPVVRALDELAAPTTPQSIGHQMGVSAAGGAFRDKLASAGYYGFITRQGDRRAITDRGVAAVGEDEAAAITAKQEAIMSTGFGKVLYRLRGREAKDDVVAVRLQEDLGVPPTAAARVATICLEAARQATLISDGRFDPAAIEAQESLIPKEDGSAPAKTAAAPKTLKPSTSKPAAPSTTKQRPKADSDEGRPFGQPVQVVVNVDASKLSAKEIADLVRELQKPPTEPSAS